MSSTFRRGFRGEDREEEELIFSSACCSWTNPNLSQVGEGFGKLERERSRSRSLGEGAWRRELCAPAGDAAVAVAGWVRLDNLHLQRVVNRGGRADGAPRKCLECAAAAASD